MTSRLLQVTVDCRNPHRLARFWAAVLDYRVIEDKDDQVEIASWEPTVEAVRREPMPSTVMFIRVPEGKTAEPRTGRRIHLDVMPTTGSRDDEVERLKGLGATEYEATSPTAPAW
jgi:hypothetical protein